MKTQTPSSEYWKDRYTGIESIINGNAAQTSEEIKQSFFNARLEIDGEIEKWVNRIADNNKISYSDAQKLLNANELAEFKWDVKQYIKFGKENAVNQQWVKQLENASAKHHITRLEALKVQINQRLEVAYGDVEKKLTKVNKFAYKEGYYRSIFELQKGMGVGYDFARINNKYLDKLLYKPWAPDGANFSSRLWKSKASMVTELQKELMRNCILGKSPKDTIKYMTSFLDEKVKNATNSAARLVMTETAYFSSVAQKDSFLELGVEEYEIVATLDSHTSQICQDYDGKHFPMEDFEPGVTSPPFHVFCRSTTVPWFPDEYSENMRAARDEDGKTYYINSDMEYKEWYNEYINNPSKQAKTDNLINLISNANNNDWQGLNYSSNYTKSEAIKRLKDEYNIEFKDSKMYPMDESLLNDCVGWVDSFKEQYKGFIRNNPCKLPQIANKAPTSIKGSVGQYRYYTNSASAIELSLNGAYHSNIKAFQEYVDRTVKNGYTVKNATIHKTFVHEYGHHVSNSLRWISKNPNWQSEFIEECLVDFRKIDSKYAQFKVSDMGGHVSRYGTKNENELFAETFAEYFGGSNPREFAVIFGEKLDKVLKGVK